MADRFAAQGCNVVLNGFGDPQEIERKRRHLEDQHGVRDCTAAPTSAAFHVVRLVLPGMRRCDFGRIVNISSVYGLFGTVTRVDDVTTRTALIGFTRAEALEDGTSPDAICAGDDRATAGGLHGRAWPVARSGAAGVHGVAPAVRSLRGDRGRRRSRRLPVRPDRRDITGAAPLFSGSDTRSGGLIFAQSVQ